LQQTIQDGALRGKQFGTSYQSARPIEKSRVYLEEPIDLSIDFLVETGALFFDFLFACEQGCDPIPMW
jgi:hypothetical protein